MWELAAGVNKLAEVDLWRLKVEERNRQSLKELRKEDAEKNRKPEEGIGWIIPVNDGTTTAEI